MIILRKIKALIVIVVILIALLLLLTNSKHMWSMFGVCFCENPEIIYVTSVTKNAKEKTFTLQGGTTSSAKKYAGYTYYEQDGNIYVGLKYNLLWGYENEAGNFNITIPYEGDSMKKIYINSLGAKKQIYPNR